MRHGTPNGGQCVPLTALRFCLALALLNASTAFAQTITEYAIPTPETKTRTICAGPDGALWFNEPHVNKIGRITTSGDITEFDVGHSVDAVAAGSDGNIWFTGAGIVGRITPAGVSTIFPAVASSSPPDSSPFPTSGGDNMAAGPDGNLWITDPSGNSIKRLTTGGAVTEFAIPTYDSNPRGIAAGPDGNIWFTEEEGNKIGRITPQGGVAPLCTPDAHTLCLNNNRFAATAGFQLSPTGPTFEATAVRLTGDSGYFWFFSENNVEVVVKLLNGCFDPFNSYWVFAAGLTNVEVDLFVTDMLSSQTRHYTNPLGTAMQPIQDTAAFKTCP